MMTSYIVGLKSRYYEHADGHQYTRQDILAAIDKAASMKDAAHAADLALLRDPAFVLTSMLCGSVAKISARQWLDAGGDATEMRDALRVSPSPSGLREACEALAKRWSYRYAAWPCAATELRAALAAAPEADRDRGTPTEEMIQAGMSALHRKRMNRPTDRNLVVGVYEAMRLVSP